MDVAHVALTVTDLEASRSFYEALGLDYSHEFEHGGVTNLYVGGDSGQLQLRQDPERTTPVAPTRADVDHIALQVEDRAAVEDAFERALEAGGAALTEPTVIEPADAHAAFVEDPDGYAVELFAPR